MALIKSDETPKAITQLSELMRYILRDSKADFVSLEKELAYIGNYVALQRKRLGDTVRIDYTPPVYAGGKKIAPLLLMSFIENAFKHGVNPDEDSWIDLKILVDEHNLRLHVFNRKVSRGQDDEWSGIGLQNTKDRLQHLYPLKHELKIQENENIFDVTLIINLA